MVSTPKLPTNTGAPPPPTPSQLTQLPTNNKPNLGGTFLTQSMPNAAPLKKPAKTLLGQ